MSNPQQPELARSRKTPHQDQDSVASLVDAQREPGADAPRGPVPPENQPGHHPAQEQDKPDMDAFAERLGITDSASQRSGSTAATDPVPKVRAPFPRFAAVAGVLVAVLLGVLVTKRRRRGRRR